VINGCVCVCVCVCACVRVCVCACVCVCRADAAHHRALAHQLSSAQTVHETQCTHVRQLTRGNALLWHALNRLPAGPQTDAAARVRATFGEEKCACTCVSEVWVHQHTRTQAYTPIFPAPVHPGSLSLPPEPSDCADRRVSCPVWHAVNACTMHAVWMHPRCPATCGLCRPGVCGGCVWCVCVCVCV
jgi:hypothetical protein